MVSIFSGEGGKWKGMDAEACDLALGADYGACIVFMPTGLDGADVFFQAHAEACDHGA